MTDDPEPVDLHHWEINNGATATWRREGTSAGIPLDINYGAARNLQLHVQPRLSYESSQAGDRAGLDDTEIGVKYRFADIEGEHSSFMAGVYPIYQLATAKKSLGGDRGRHPVFLPVWLQGESGPWTVYGGAGYRVNPGDGNRNSVFTGVALLYKATSSLQLGGELFHETRTSIDGESTTSFNLGGIRRLGGHSSLLFSAGRGLRDPTANNQVSVYVALQLAY